MNERAISTWKAIALLTRLRLLRLVNLLYVVGSQRIGGGRSRLATPRKRRSRGVVSALVAIFMVFSFGNLIRQGIVNLHLALDPDTEPLRRGLAALLPGTFSEALIGGLTMEMTLLFIVVLLISLGTRELASPDWDLEWLVTLPSSRHALLLSRLAERTIANPTGVLVFWPACSLIALYSGARWNAVWLGPLAALPLLLLAAIARTLVDTGLRLSLAPSRLRNLQALISVSSVLLLYLAMSTGIGPPTGLVFEIARDFPRWAEWTPFGLVVRTLNASGSIDALSLAALTLVQVVLVMAVALKLLDLQLRHGVVAAGSREASRARLAPAARPLREWSWLPLGVVQRRELRLLSRDRNFLVQSLVLPVVIVGSQVMMQGRFGRMSAAGFSPTLVAAIAFAIAAYALMLSAFQTLNTEGGALWMLYTLPRRLDAILIEKLRMWCALVLIYPALVFGADIALMHRVDSETIGLASIVVLGVPIYSTIATALGVFACDPLAQQVASRLRPTFVYLYMLLAAMYTYAIYTSLWSQRLVLVALSALLAHALWQKAKDQLPYLLDPTASPPSRVSTADGMIAAMMFFVFQGIGALFESVSGRPLTGADLIENFLIAGALTYGIMRLSFWRSKTLGVPAILRKGASAAALLGWGAGMGAVAITLGLAYLVAIDRLGLRIDLMSRSTIDIRSSSAGFAALAILAAPLFEEFIFRGLIFGGLRRTLPLAYSVFGSAAIFAIAHPPVSMIPVFALGVAAALAYERTGSLLAPMLSHALYNAVLIIVQWHPR